MQINLLLTQEQEFILILETNNLQNNYAIQLLEKLKKGIALL